MGNLSAPTISIRIAKPSDLEALGALLVASYSTLLKGSYDRDLLARALPHITKANPILLASGTYYVAETKPGDVVGCGGWTREMPGTQQITEGEAHIRHFATHPVWTRQGIGIALLTHCIDNARALGIRKLYSLSTLNAERFYRAAGFHTVRPIGVQFGPELAFPGVLMIREMV